MKQNFIYGILKGMAILPLGVLYLFSDLIVFVIYHIVKYRRKVVRANLTSSFPDKNLKEIKKIEKEFYRYLGDQIIETLKILHISDRELSKRIKVKGSEIINSSLTQGKSVVIFMGHYGNWEWVQEVSRYFFPNYLMASIYHPLDNKVWDNIFFKLRSRWGANIIPMNKAPRILMKNQNQPWVCGFIADAWTGYKKADNWTEFLNHKTWFIYGPEEIGNKVGADFFYLDMHRVKRGYYEISLSKLNPEINSETYPYSREFWRLLQQTIVRQPPYWLWSHKRWK